MNVKLLAYTPGAEAVCATAAAICRRKTPTARSLTAAMKSGHTSVAEHATFTFEIRGISRACLAQLTRHRHASYSVESQRAVETVDLAANAIIPESFERMGIDPRPLLTELQHMYDLMLSAGVPREDARYLLPEATTTNLVMTMNARELRHFFSLRCCNRAQWEIRALANEMLALCRLAAPLLFEDAGAPCMCGLPCPEREPCANGNDRQGRSIVPASGRDRGALPLDDDPPTAGSAEGGAL